MPSIQSLWLTWVLGLVVVGTVGLAPLGGEDSGDHQAVLSAEAERWVAILSRLDWFPRRAARGKPQDLPEEAVAFDPDEGAWYVTIDGQPGVPKGWSGLLIWKERSLPEPVLGVANSAVGRGRRIWWFFRGIPAWSGWDAPLEMEGWLTHGTRGTRLVFAATDPGRGSGVPPQWGFRFAPAAPLAPGSCAKKLHARRKNARSGAPGGTAGKWQADQGPLLEG